MAVVAPSPHPLPVTSLPALPTLLPPSLDSALPTPGSHHCPSSVNPSIATPLVSPVPTPLVLPPPNPSSVPTQHFSPHTHHPTPGSLPPPPVSPPPPSVYHTLHTPVSPLVSSFPTPGVAPSRQMPEETRCEGMCYTSTGLRGVRDEQRTCRCCVPQRAVTVETCALCREYDV